MKSLNLAKSADKKFLLNYFGYDSIYVAKKEMQFDNAKNGYKTMKDMYIDIETIKQENKKKKIAGNKIVNVAKKFLSKKNVPYMITIDVEIIYKNKIDNKIVFSKPYYNSYVYYDNILSKVNSYLNIHNFETSVETSTVLNYNIEYQNVKSKKTNVINQPMKNSFILKNNWLKFSSSIANYAYNSTDNICVPYQLNKFLNDPPSGRPTKKIRNGVKMTENNIISFFEELMCNSSEPYDIQLGVSVYMVEQFCKLINRNYYAFDDNDKCFSMNTTYDKSDHYCAIIFYKLYGHLYVINDKAVFRKVAEQNKKLSTKMISSTLINDKKEKEDKPTYFINEFDNNFLDYKEGLYIIQKHNLENEMLHIYNNKIVPKTKTVNNIIKSLTFKNKSNENVTIECDANFGKNIDYNDIKNVCKKNDIIYNNEGFGSVVLNIAEKRLVEKRISITNNLKNNIIEINGSCCSMCNLKCDTFEIDHIIPLSCGGKNTNNNLQLLCINCYKAKSIEENELGLYKTFNQTESYFNPNVWNNIIKHNSFQFHQFVEHVNTDYDSANNSNIHKLDFVKCRRNNLYYNKYEIPVYSVMDNPVQFSGDIIKCGMYYVITNNTFPFRGAGWYMQSHIDYGLECNLISMDDIKLEFIPSKTLPCNYFQGEINNLLEVFKDEPQLQKMSVNTFVGLMGRSKHTSCKSKFTTCEIEASNWLCENKQIFIRNHTLDTCMLYQGIFTEDIFKETSTLPIYNLVLSLEAIGLHKLEQQLKNEGAIILDRNTDAIRYYNDVELKFNEFYDDAKTIAKYQKEENPQPLKHSHMEGYCRKHELDLDTFDLNWNIKYDYHNVEEIINSNQSVHIDGRAGTGKSFLTNKIIMELENQGKKHLSFSPTNKGARIIGGRTIHSLYNKYKHSKKNLDKYLKNIDYIIIDEVSMMEVKFYNLFLMIKKLFSNIKYLIVGDYDQLPPVNDIWSGDYKNSPATFELCQGNRIQLTKCMRANDKLFNLCKYINLVNLDDFKFKQPTYLNVAYTHKTRIRINNDCIKRYLEENNQTGIYLPKDENNAKTQNVFLCKGMPIIAHNNLFRNKGILNTEKFTIKYIDKTKLIIKDDDREIILNTCDFHKIFYIGFCITIHACQGETFNEPYTIYDWNCFAMCDKAKYVALSRATNIKNIQIIE